MVEFQTLIGFVFLGVVPWTFFGLFSEFFEIIIAFLFGVQFYVEPFELVVDLFVSDGFLL